MDIKKAKELVALVKELEKFCKEVEEINAPKMQLMLIPEQEPMEAPQISEDTDPQELMAMMTAQQNQMQSSASVSLEAEYMKELINAIREYCWRLSKDAWKHLKEEITGEQAKEGFDDTITRLVNEIEMESKKENYTKAALFKVMIDVEVINAKYKTNGCYSTLELIKGNNKVWNQISGNRFDSVWMKEGIDEEDGYDLASTMEPDEVIRDIENIMIQAGLSGKLMNLDIIDGESLSESDLGPNTKSDAQQPGARTEEPTLTEVREEQVEEPMPYPVERIARESGAEFPGVIPVEPETEAGLDLQIEETASETEPMAGLDTIADEVVYFDPDVEEGEMPEGE